MRPQDYQAPDDLLRDKVILVTGAGDGIGRAAALAFAARGATLILLGRTVEKLEAVYDAIESAGGAQPALFPLDLTTATEQDCEQLASAIGETFGRLDGLLHNASLLGERRPIANSSLSAWQEVMQVNVNAAFLLTRTLLPLLEQAPQASVVFTSSGVGRRGRAYWGAYAVSKFATEGLMQVLADELENTSRVRVNSLNPGATNTAMRRSAYPAEDPTRNPSPDEILPAYLYLMGDDSVGMTGQALDAQ
ncbi:MAG: YciK family oxidoreductase [Haliea sp.]|nr:YciK family oxidoreductase [Haliea sp.]|tara:strand:- start:33957 stop:34703 length:747 start_codon:yes stop_codon:yes gene_type:complete